MTEAHGGSFDFSAELTPEDQLEQSAPMRTLPATFQVEPMWKDLANPENLRT